LAHASRPVPIAGPEDSAEGLGAPARREEHIEEAGSSDVEPIDRGGLREVRDDRFGDLARGLARLTREGHRDVRGVVAVARLTGWLPEDRRRDRQPGPAEGLPQRLRQQIGYGWWHRSSLETEIAAHGGDSSIYAWLRDRPNEITSDMPVAPPGH